MTTYSEAVCRAGQHKDKLGHTKRSDMDHAVLSANYTTPAFLFRKRSPDGATPNCGGRHLTGAYYSFIDPEGTKD